MNYNMNYKERIIDILTNKELTSEQEKQLETIFPELAESEDEKIRNEIIQFLQLPHPQFVGKRNHAEWIAWLEKLKVFTEHGDGLYHFGNSEFTYVGNPIWDNTSFLEKHGEQKTFDYEHANIQQKDFAPKPQRMVSAEVKEALYDKSLGVKRMKG